MIKDDTGGYRGIHGDRGGYRVKGNKIYILYAVA